MKFYKWVLITFRPLVLWFGYLFVSRDRDQLKKSDVDQIKNVIQKGDYLYSFKEGEMTNIIFPGDYKHGAIYIGNGEIIEAVGQGVRITAIEDFLYSKDMVRVKRAYGSAHTRDRIAECAIMYHNFPYDFEYESEDDEIYCFEMLALVYRDATGNDLKKTKVLDGEFYSFDSFEDNRKFQNIIEVGEKNAI